MKIYDISKYICSALAIAFACASCSSEEDITGQSQNNAQTGKGLYAQVSVAGSNVTTRATDSSDKDLCESDLAHLFMIIGNTQGNKSGKFQIIRYTSEAISPEGRILILDTDSWKESFPKVTSNSSEEVPYHVAVIGNTSGLTYDENTKILTGKNSTGDFTIALNTDEDGTSYLTQEQVNTLLKAIQTDENIYLQYNDNDTLKTTTTEPTYDSKPYLIGKIKGDTKFLMYGHTTWNPSEYSEDEDLVIIKVPIERAAAKLQGTFVLSPTLLAEWKMVSYPKCRLGNYATTAMIADKGLDNSGDSDTDFDYSPTVITTEKYVPMIKSGDNYIVNAYSYPFSWASGSGNSAPYFCVNCTMQKRSDDSDSRNFEFHVPIIADETITSLERNNIYKVNVIWNFIETGNNTNVTYKTDATTISYEIADWTDNTVKNYTVNDETVYGINRQLKSGSNDKYDFNGFSWNNPTINGYTVDEITNKISNDNNKRYKVLDKDAVGCQLHSHLYISAFSKSGLTIDLQSKMDNGDYCSFYVVDKLSDNTEVKYKFNLEFCKNPSNDDSSNDVTITEETSAVKAVSSVTNGYVAYATKLPDVEAVKEAILATPSATTDNYVSPAFVFVTNIETSSEATVPSTTAFGYSDGWRLPTQNEIKFINAKLSSALTSGSNYWTYDGSVVDNTGTTTSATSAIAIAVHDISASELATLLNNIK